MVCFIMLMLQCFIIPALHSIDIQRNDGNGPQICTSLSTDSFSPICSGDDAGFCIGKTASESIHTYASTSKTLS